MTCVAPACTLKEFVLGPVVVEEVVDVVVVDEVDVDEVVVVEEAASKVAMVPAHQLPPDETPDDAVPVLETIFSRTEVIPVVPVDEPSINVNPFVGPDVAVPYELMPPSQSSFALVVVGVVPVTELVPAPLVFAV